MSADRKFCATIHIKPNNRHCFVELSNSIAKQYTSTISDKLPPIVGIESSSAAIAFASWRPHKSTQLSQDDQVLFLGKGFADCLSLKEDDSVLIYFVTNAVPLEKVFIAPIKNKEWEILNTLNIPKSKEFKHVFNGPSLHKELNTQLIEASLLDQIRVAYSALEFPIFLKGSAIVNAKVESVSPNVKVGYLEEFTELHIAPELAKKSVISRDEKKISRKFDRLSKKTLQSKSTTVCEKSDSALSSLWNFIVKQGPEEIKEFSKNTIHANTHSRPTASFCAGQEIINKTKHISEVLRIHPVAPRKSDTQNRNLFTLNYHPFRCIVSMSTFKSIKRQCTCVFKQETNKLIMKITTIPSPRQKDERRKIKARNTDNSSVAEKENSAIVEIVPVNDDKFPDKLQMKNMAVSLEVMAHLNADQGSLIEIECLHKNASHMLGIIINVLSKKVPSLDTEKVTEIFRGWAERRIQQQQDQLLLNDSTILEINKLEEPAVVVSLDFLTAKDNEPSEQSYFFLNRDSLTTVSWVANFRTDEGARKLTNYQNRDRILENFKLFKGDQLGGFRDLIDRGIAYLNNILKPSHKDTDIRPFSHKGSMLICAASRTMANGSGRSALALELCNAFRQSPYFCHIENIDCISLRGKKPETILRKMQVAMEEARWRQPSIVVFDDVDYLIKQPDPVKDAEPTVQYHSKLAEECSLVLHPPDEAAREEILYQIVKRLSRVFANPADVKKMAALTEGHLPADLETILKRAKNSSIMKSKINSERRALDLDDFKAGCNGYKPLGLHGIELHSPGNLGWNHVGGLVDAKKVLLETFVWPMKYVHLFSKCPFRMRSGVLLYGPSGTGKTLLAGVVAKECGMNFISIKGPELLSKYVGSSEQNVRDLFARAQSASPCILFFDEFDALAPKRGHDNTGVTDRVVNQLLTQLDGVEKLEKVFVLAATSRPDLIDPALLRPGRLDKCVYCPMPDALDRVEIFKALSLDLAMDQNIDINSLSKNTEDFSGADIKAVLYNAQLTAIHKKHPTIIAKALQSPEKMKISDEDLSMKISNDDITEALKETRPSVSATEMARYEAIFRNFNSSRKGDLRAEEIDTRVTLA